MGLFGTREAAPAFGLQGQPNFEDRGLKVAASAANINQVLAAWDPGGAALATDSWTSKISGGLC